MRGGWAGIQTDTAGCTKKKGSEWGTKPPKGLKHGALDAQAPSGANLDYKMVTNSNIPLWCAILSVPHDSRRAQNRSFLF